MGSIDLFLEDEGQQYGNMEEAATVARTPATCLEVWSGDHRQTPGGLEKSQEAKAFRKKLTKRPLALRCQTRYVQAHDLEKIVLRYLDCPKESFAWKLRQLLIDGSSAIDPAVGQFWHEHFGDSLPCLSTEIQRAAYAILWLGLRGEREGLPSMLATSFAEAAGVSGRQKWGLVLSSNARVSQVTYQTVVGVRYPELVTTMAHNGSLASTSNRKARCQVAFFLFFGMSHVLTYMLLKTLGRCDFQPDAKSNLAVLHNRNDMTNLFRASNWISSSNDSIVSRGVTTCAGMTAHTVLLAQTKVWFLTEGRKKSFRLLSEDEQMVQREEAYARATVAITRARSLCLIMGPLDMKGLLEAATVMGTLMYGDVWEGQWESGPFLCSALVLPCALLWSFPVLCSGPSLSSALVLSCALLWSFPELCSGPSLSSALVLSCALLWFFPVLCSGSSLSSAVILSSALLWSFPVLCCGPFLFPL